ncbi:MAG: MFS transporter [Pseudomonadota bacterium]
MSVISRVPALAPFEVRSFRYQWPADLLTSWAFEMEAVVLGWYVLVSTGSVLALAVFGSLQFLGTLISPLFGMAGDRIGNRNLLCLMRGTYLAVAAVLAGLFLADIAAPWSIFILATLTGLVRPSDITLRNLLVGETMPSDYLMRAMGVSRTTADSARVVGALTGAGLVAMLGSGPAYLGICLFYAASLALTFRVGVGRLRVLGEQPIRTPLVRALREGFAYVWSTPDMRAVMLLAFLVNFAAYPLVGSLLAYVARDVYGMGQTGLGWLIACFAGGALAGSIAISFHGSAVRPARIMLVCAVLWFSLNLVFSWMKTPLLGEAVLFMAGFVQSLCMIPMAVLLLRVTTPAFRGRVMGVRMLAVYGMPLGLLLAGPLVEHAGFPVTGTVYSVVGIVFTLLIGLRWRACLWDVNAAANAR